MIPLGGPADVPPPPVCLLVEGDLVCLMMQKPLPDPAAPGQMYDWFIPTIFRVREGKLAEHWGAFRKGDSPLPAQDAV
jgi:predicted SnoaL-like aldol condensation-catalyzing enzyme